MPEFLFGYHEEAHVYGWRVSGKTEADARERLHCLIHYDDPCGYLVTWKNMQDNFTVIESAQHETDVDDWLSKHVKFEN